MALNILSRSPPPPNVSYLLMMLLSSIGGSVGLARIPISCISLDLDLYRILCPAGFSELSYSGRGSFDILE